MVLNTYVSHHTTHPLMVLWSVLFKGSQGAMKKGLKDGLQLEVHLASFLLTYHTTAHGTTDIPPCMLFMGHSLHTHLDILGPDSAAQVLEKQAQEKEQHDAHACERKLGRL